MRRRALSAAALAALAAAACGRLDHVGKPPSFTPPGQSLADAAPILPERVALATPGPAEIAARGSAPVSAYEGARSASLWRGGPASLLGDRRARTRGDILTVVIEIDEEAEISNATQRTRAGAEDMSIDALFGLPDLVDDLTGIDLSPAAQINSNSTAAGAGSVRRNEEITLRLAATVAEVLPNGHFVIVGNQEVRVNFELRDLRVQGVVRPEDINRKNEIPLEKIADARVSYGGRGQITDVQQPRYGQQVADIILPF